MVSDAYSWTASGPASNLELILWDRLWDWQTQAGMVRSRAS